jgi:hypothetical protein
VKKIERRQTPQVQEVELATFAERDAFLKRARDVGLPPREYELFRLSLEDSKRFLRNGRLNYSEAAREMGVAVRRSSHSGQGSGKHSQHSRFRLNSQLIV